jgi:pimeloyl-ACP methyl ester carboxylesterase
MRYLRRKLTIFFCLPLAAGGLYGTGASASAATSAYGTCRDVTVPVSLGPGLPQDQIVSGTVCDPLTPNPDRRIDMLVHGGTYNRSYWDYAVDQPEYSYVDRALLQGRATFAFDRVGAGASSHPLSAVITLPGDAYTLHQLIGWLRSVEGYQDITLIGHSIGAGVAIQETATYNDANRLVVTGLLHALSLPGVFAVGTSFYSVTLDSQFADSGLDSGYLTSIPGKRQAVFYSPSADPAVIAYDEAHKDAMASVELTGVLSSLEVLPGLNVSRGITVPTLSVVGQQDISLCGMPLGVDCSSDATVASHEAPYYSNAPSFAAAVIPATGHDLALHPSASQSFAVINQWIQSGQGAGTAWASKMAAVRLSAARASSRRA